MIELLTVGWVLWTSIILFAILALIGLETESWGWLTFITVVYFAIFGWKLTLATLTWQAIIRYVGVYIGIGAMWSVFKWWRHSRSVLADYNDGKINDRSAKSELNVGTHRAKIIAWIAYWPLSVFWAITHDIFNSIWKLLRGLYSSISNAVLAEIVKAENAKDK